MHSVYDCLKRGLSTNNTEDLELLCDALHPFLDQWLNLPPLIGVSQRYYGDDPPPPVLRLCEYNNKIHKFKRDISSYQNRDVSIVLSTGEWIRTPIAIKGESSIVDITFGTDNHCLLLHVHEVRKTIDLEFLLFGVSQAE